MSKQTNFDLPTMCQHRSVCMRDATIGTYRFLPGQTDVNLDIPARVFCGQHKPKLNYRQGLRNVRIRRAP